MTGLTVIEGVASDRGSKYAVSGGPCAGEDDAKALVKELLRRKKFAKATHHSWGLITAAGPVKNDDGESGAGMAILRVLEREGLEGHAVIVTRWYGGKHLGGDRFRHVTDAAQLYIRTLRES